jgi:exopolyphosphatase/guanosine-5'-triphosphate,3'-diphosphate pyrophosphatase
MIDHSLGATGADPHDQQRAIERFAAGCGCDIKHSRQTARLAGLMFEQLAEELGLAADDRRLLEAAAHLQDVGYLINYEKHHKHSYHLILNSRLPGFQPHELELIANIARYHRGKEPKKKHENFSRLSPKDQQRVRSLAAVLRFAGGLDRSNTQQVQTLEMTLGEDDAVLCVVSAEHPEVDLWAARRRAEPLEKALGRTLTLQWRPPEQPPSGKRKSAKQGEPSGNHREGKNAEQAEGKARAR